MSIDTTFEIKFIPGYHEKYNLEPGEIAPQTFGMYWCMYATGINRIFTSNHLEEFLFRLAIVMENTKLVENWFGWDQFILFNYNDLEYVLSAKDVLNHIGFEASNSTNDCISREDFLNNIGTRITNAQFQGTFFGNFQVLKPMVKRNEVGTLRFWSTAKEYVSDITEALKSKAEFFARDILKNATPDAFILTDAAAEQLKEIEKRLQNIRDLPRFDFDQVPKDVTEDCFYAMFDMKYAEQLLKEPSSDEYRRIGKKYIYLAWLYANELLWIENGHDFNHLEGISFDPQEYADETGGWNIPEFIDDYNMDECKPFLKGLFFDKK